MYLVGLQVEVLQGGGNSGNAGEFVVRQVQFHQAGEVEDLRLDFLQAAVTQAKVLEVEEAHEAVVIQPGEAVAGQVELLDRRGEILGDGRERIVAEVQQAHAQKTCR